MAIKKIKLLYPSIVEGKEVEMKQMTFSTKGEAVAKVKELFPKSLLMDVTIGSYTVGADYYGTYEYQISPETDVIAILYVIGHIVPDVVTEDIKLCHCCMNVTLIERSDKRQPAEGHVCSICGKWFCDNCINWKASDDDGLVCTSCSCSE